MNWSKEWGKPQLPLLEGREREEFINKVQKIQTITTRYHNKTRQINVTVVGDLGLDFDEDGWNIYHIPTLAFFDKAVPDKEWNFNGVMTPSVVKSSEYEKLELLNWMAKVQSTCDSKTKIMWNELKRLTPQTYENGGRLAKEIIQKWCLSVKVE